MRRPLPLAPVACLILLVLVLPACNIIAAVAVGVGGDNQAALHKLDPARPTVLFVDDPLRVFANPIFPRTIAANAQFHLLEHRVVDTLIPQEELEAHLQTLGDNAGTTAIDEIGRALGAEQVIYVRLQSISVSTEPGSTKPRLVADVRVVDALTGARIWPDERATVRGDAPGHTHVTQLSHGSQTGARTPSAAETYRAVSERAGRDIARLFYNAFIGNDEP